jgi:hypothetical protein
MIPRQPHPSIQVDQFARTSFARKSREMISHEAHWPWSMNLPQVSLLAKKVIAKHVQFTVIEN